MKVEFPIPIHKERHAVSYDRGRDQLLAGTRGKLVSEEKRQVAGADGRKYVILTDDGGRLIELISVILAGENYNISVMADKTTFPRAAADAFFASVQPAPPSR